MRNTFKSVSFGSIADGTFYSTSINAETVNHSIYIEFYPNDNFTQSELVPKSSMSGTVTFAATANSSVDAGVGEEYISVPNATLTLGSNDYNIPDPKGLIRRISVTFNSVVGATHYKLIVHSAEG